MKESSSGDYSVSINGQEVDICKARVSAIPFNQMWPGYQRPLEQTELASFAYWDMDGPVQVEVVSNRPVEKVVIRPRSRQIVPTVEGNRITFTLQRPAQITVEVNGYHKALHLFGNPLEEFIPDRNDPEVIFFEPGIHEAGKIEPKSGQTVYIAAGAVVYGAIDARNVSGVKILGRGILDASRIPRSNKRYVDATDPSPFGAISFYGCDDVTIDGIITRDPNIYNVTLVACSEARVSNVKVIGSWRYNSDGIDLLNSSNVVVERCFVRSFDDSLVVTGWPRFRGLPCGHLPCHDIVMRDCVIWNEWGRALEIGATCCTPEIRNVTFQNCDVIHVAHVALDVQDVGRAKVENIRFENIRVELDDGVPAPKYQANREDAYEDTSNGTYCPRLCVAQITTNIWTWDKEPGHMKGIVFKDIVATGRKNPPSHLSGHDAEHVVEDVSFENVVIEGCAVTDAETCFLSVEDHVRDVQFRAKTAEQSAEDKNRHGEPG